MKKMGRALKFALGQSEDGTSVLTEDHGINAIEVCVLAYFLNNPCSSLTSAARWLDINRSTLRWHISRMNARGVLVAHRSGRSTVYYPKGVVRKGEVESLALMVEPTNRALLDQVESSQGLTIRDFKAPISQKNIRTRLAALSKHGLVESIKEGRNVRYYPTGRGDMLLKDIRKRLKNYQPDLTAILRETGLEFKVTEDLQRNIQFIIDCQDEKLIINLY